MAACLPAGRHSCFFSNSQAPASLACHLPEGRKGQLPPHFCRHITPSAGDLLRTLPAAPCLPPFPAPCPGRLPPISLLPREAEAVGMEYTYLCL